MAKWLRFADLSQRHSGISDGISDSYSEAACVCLDRHHKSPADFRLQDNDTDDTAGVEWVRADERIRGAWANEDDATEAGAYGIAIAAIEALRGLVAVRRAETRTGADYYLGEPGNMPEDLEAASDLRSQVQTGETKPPSKADYVKRSAKPPGETPIFPP
jgi:hypothetical protein